MTALVIFIAATAVSIRTMLYGVWNFKQRNFAGGVFVVLLAAIGTFLAARYYFIS